MQNDIIDTMQKTLEQLKDEFSVLKIKAEQVELSIEVEYALVLEDLKLELDDAQKNIDIIKLAHHDQWDELKDVIEKNWKASRVLIESISAP